MAQFSDFTIAAYRLVTHFPSIAEQYRRQYSQVLLDEYQDTSTTQAMLIATLFHKKTNGVEEASVAAKTSENQDFLTTQQTNIAAVGDPFQAIYSFRGASSGAFRKLEQALNIDQSSEFSLTRTRRNSQLILKAANSITKPLRVPALRHSSSLATEVEVKNLQYLDNAPKGTFSVLNMPTQYQEVEAVVRFVKYVKHNALSENDDTNSASARVAVLFRSKNNIPLYEEALQKAGLRTLTVGYSALLEKPEIRDVLALLSVVADHTNTQALMRLLATPRFALNTDDLAAIANIATSKNIEYVFRALVQAGLVNAETPRSKWSQVVREQQSQASQTNSIHGGVFVADVLLEAYETQLSEEAKNNDNNNNNLLFELKNNLSSKAYIAVLRIGQMIHAIQRAQSGSLQDIMRVAVETLNVDIDVALSRALMNDTSSNATLLDDMHSTVDSICLLADAYLQEMSDFTTPTLHGFMSWIFNIDKINDQPSSVDEAADVVLMTIHQSKGLEWPAVAIVGLNEGAFPSNQGDNLRVIATQQSGVYRERAYATLEVASKVPVSMRVDANILPRFPHDVDLETSMEPQKSLKNMLTVDDIDAEVYGSRAREMFDLAEKFHEHEQAPVEAIPSEASKVYDAVMKTGTLPLSQVEERGRALHIDERHLMYVALTRAKFAALLTCSQSNAMSVVENKENFANSAASSVDESSNISTSRVKKPSVFWQEMYDSMRESEESPVQATAKVSDSSNQVGYVVGESASQLAQLFSEESTIPTEDNEKQLSWPSASSEAIRSVLQKSAQDVVNSKMSNQISGISKDNSLLYKAQALLQDADLMPKIDWYHNIQELKNRAEQLSNVENVNVTAVQRRAMFRNDYSRANEDFNDADAKRLRKEWMAIIRPIPSVSSPASDLGTRFHAWAEQFVKAGCVNKNSIQYDVDENVDENAVENVAETCENISQNAKSSERKLLIWKQRLITSKWAHRRPIAAEQPIVAHVPELGDQIINGKIDAIFAGGLNPEDPSKLYTIVDWKTGRKPTKPQDIALKLGQLDWYRLLLSLMTKVPLDAIDATLYYVNISDECEREIHAEQKTKDEILAELHSDTLISLDDDDA